MVSTSFISTHKIKRTLLRQNLMVEARGKLSNDDLYTHHHTSVLKMEAVFYLKSNRFYVLVMLGFYF